jgi:hypothetical protein
VPANGNDNDVVSLSGVRRATSPYDVTFPEELSTTGDTGLTGAALDEFPALLFPCVPCVPCGYCSYECLNRTTQSG